VISHWYLRRADYSGWDASNMKTTTSTKQVEREVSTSSGWVALPLNLVALFGSIALFIFAIVAGVQSEAGHPQWVLLVLSIILFIGSLIAFGGFFTLEPNEARVLVLFGRYVGTVRQCGFYWGNPWYSNGSSSSMALTQLRSTGSEVEKAAATNVALAMQKHKRNKISLRARNLESGRLKVNDKRGNPIEIAAVVVWRVRDTAQAMFDVDDYEHFVSIQSEAAIRHLASHYAYDHGEVDEVTLLGDIEQVSADLLTELQERLDSAGVQVEESRLTHLAYAPEIAQAMLRRQQAEAVIAARQKIVHGAVGMVQMALDELAEKKVVELDDERRAAMVSNLLVVLCGESEVHPVVNTGTLYN
jgi:regulator of protease activity HflC (stomatin/prohibitin superfamily)